MEKVVKLNNAFFLQSADLLNLNLSNVIMVVRHGLNCSLTYLQFFITTVIHFSQ